MSKGRRGNELKKLYRQRDAKFDEIVACLVRELLPNANLTKTDWQRLAEDAEELTDNWAAAEADKRPLEANTGLQRLLSQHQQICRRIIDMLDAGLAED
jgi:hypothetical protein